MKRFRFLSKKTIIAGSVIFVSFLFILMAFAPALSGAGQTATPATAEKSYIPNPTLNTQATWTSFNSSMAYNQYVNATGKPAYLNVEPANGNYISINPADIISKGYLQQEKLGGYEPWNESTTAGLSTTNISYTVNPITENGVQILGIEANVTGTNGGWASGNTMQIPISDYASSNLAYDYLTMIISANLTGGADSNIQVFNSTGTSIAITPSITTGEAYITISMQALENKYNIGLNDTAGKGYSSYLGIQNRITLPSGAAVGKYYSQIDAIALTTYPITFGSNATGTVITQETGNIHLANFKPPVPITILNNGYSENLTQPLSITKETINQNSMTGTYAEAITEQGILSIPSTPDVSFGNSFINMNLSGINGKQYQVLNLNGISYTSQISNMTGNKTINLGTVNPANSNSVIVEVELTTSQWNQISKPPSFFSVRGLEYYWWVGLIGALSAIGLGAAAMTHFGGDEEDLKIPKGKFGR